VQNQGIAFRGIRKGATKARHRVQNAEWFKVTKLRVMVVGLAVAIVAVATWWFSRPEPYPEQQMFHTIQPGMTSAEVTTALRLPELGPADSYAPLHRLEQWGTDMSSAAKCGTWRLGNCVVFVGFDIDGRAISAQIWQEHTQHEMSDFERLCRRLGL
jgi:hypothetical protein